MPETLAETQQEAHAVQMDHESNQQSIKLEDLSQMAAPDQSQAEQAESQIYKHTHSNGNEFSGTLTETRKICPVIGKMSIENAQATLQDADLASRVAQRGRERREAEAKKEDVRRTEAPDTKLEKAQTEQAVHNTEASADKIIKPKIDQINKFVANEPKVSDMRARHVPHAETPPVALGSTIEFAEMETPRDVESRAPVGAEPIIHQRNENLSGLPSSVPKIIEHKNVEAETIVAKGELPATYETPLGPELFENVEHRISNAMSGIATVEAFEGSGINTRGTDYTLLNADEGRFGIDGSEAPHFELVDEAEAFPDIVEAHQFVSENKAQTAKRETHPLVTIHELPAPIMEIEIAMTQLAEVVESSEDTIIDEPKKIDEILQRIITLPTKFEAADSEEVEELEQELEVLFVELFEEADMNYSFELIESFVKLTKAHYLEEVLATTQGARDENRRVETGTREFLQKLKQGLSDMRQAVTNVYEVGKSIMHLYEYSFAPASFSFRVT